MSKEILAIVNNQQRLFLWSPKSLYQGFITDPPVAVYQISKPVFSQICTKPQHNLMAFGDYTGPRAGATRTYRVQIATATKFVFSIDNGATWSAQITITRHAHALGDGIFIQFYAEDGFTVNDNWAFVVAPASFVNPVSTEYFRWSIAKWANGYFFTNLANPVKYLNGLTVWNPASNCNSMPQAKYIEMFFEHMVAANIIFEGQTLPSRVIWSDIHDFSNFGSAPTNEADFYDLNLDETFKESSLGITGIRRLGQFCYIFGPKEIVAMRYVGAPQVMIKDLVYSEVGNVFPYALAGNNKFQAFISDENFYLLEEGSIPKPIGDRIRDLFFSTLSDNPKLRYNVWSFVNRTNNEIWWVYPSNIGGGLFDKAVVWNFREDTWYPASVENIHSYGEVHLAEEPGVIDDVPDLINDVDTLVDQFGAPVVVERVSLYGTADLKILRDEVPADAIADLLPQDLPFLETKDIYYNNLETVKEIDTLLLQAGYDAANCDGIEVFVSTRANLDDAVTYVSLGKWKKDLYEGRFSLPRVSGRIFRFKFKFVNVALINGIRNVIFTAWGENVRGGPPPPPSMEK